jgi:hypothetical protein
MVAYAFVTILMGLMVPISPQLVIAIATDLVVVLGPTVCIPCTREERNKMVTPVEATLTVYMAGVTVTESAFENILSRMGTHVIILTTVKMTGVFMENVFQNILSVTGKLVIIPTTVKLAGATVMESVFENILSRMETLVITPTTADTSVAQKENVFEDILSRMGALVIILTTADTSVAFFENVFEDILSRMGALVITPTTANTSVAFFENVFEDILSRMVSLVFFHQTVETSVVLAENVTLKEKATVTNVNSIMIAVIIAVAEADVGRNIVYTITEIALITKTVEAVSATTENVTMRKNKMVKNVNTTMIVLIAAAAIAFVRSIDPVKRECFAKKIMTAFIAAVADGGV